MERPPGRKSLGWCKILWSTPPLILDSLVQRLPTVGTWLSLVEHSLGVRGVGSSNLPVPTNFFEIRAYAPAADARSPDGFAGANAIRATPMITSTATAVIRPVRSLGMCTASTAITAP